MLSTIFVIAGEAAVQIVGAILKEEEKKKK